MAALNSPGETLAEFFRVFLVYFARLSLTQQQRSVTHKVVEYGGGIHAEERFSFDTHDNYSWFQDRLVILKLLYQGHPTGILVALYEV